MFGPPGLTGMADRTASVIITRATTTATASPNAARVSHAPRGRPSAAAARDAAAVGRAAAAGKAVVGRAAANLVWRRLIYGLDSSHISSSHRTALRAAGTIHHL
jgi:hypothetical protein